MHGKLQTLRKLEPWEAERTLGIYLAPDGNMDSQMDNMKAKARDWAEKIRLGFLPCHLTWLAWQTTILKTLEYPLPVTTLTHTQCNKLTSEMAMTALPRSGIMRTFPRALLLHGPKKYGGLAIPDLYVKQGISHVSHLIRYSKTRNHSTGHLIRHSCKVFKLQMGCYGPIFLIPEKLECLATPGWVLSTWKFCHEFGIKIIDDLPEFQPLRVNDRLLIPTFARLGLAPQELYMINQCHLFLRVSWLDEIMYSGRAMN
jgi:hypothetical protein